MEEKDKKKENPTTKRNYWELSAETDRLIVTGNHILGMDVSSIDETKNFLFGVNNFASQFSQNSILLDNIADAENRLIGIMPESSRLGSITGILSESIASVKLFTEDMTTVMAYGKAVQDQFNILTENPLFKDSIATIEKTRTQFDSILGNNTIFFPSEPIASPFLFTPKEVTTEEVIKKLPEVKTELPVKTTEAIEIMEYVFDPDTKNDSKRITTTVAEIKKAIKNMQSSVVMFMQHTTQKVEITAMPKMQVTVEKSTSHTNKFPFKIPAGTTWQNIIIQFINNDMVNIQVAGHSHQTGYADMGFVDKRTNKPTIQWTLLSILAKGGGELPNSSNDASDNYKKHKQLLSEKLKDYFNIEPDPFEPYKGGYKTRITLIPPPTKQEEPKKDYSIANEVEDMFRDLTE